LRFGADGERLLTAEGAKKIREGREEGFDVRDETRAS
jgi:hypothetical protein